MTDLLNFVHTTQELTHVRPLMRRRCKNGRDGCYAQERAKREASLYRVTLP